MNERASPPAEPAMPRGDHSKPIAKPLVLIVDDEEMIRRVITLTLEPRGYRCLEAGTGAAALARCASDPRPEIVLLDMMLPDMTGGSVLARLRSDPATQAIPVIGLSGWPAESGEHGSALATLSGYLEKPFRADALVAMVSRLVR